MKVKLLQFFFVLFLLIFFNVRVQAQCSIGSVFVINIGCFGANNGNFYAVLNNSAPGPVSFTLADSASVYPFSSNDSNLYAGNLSGGLYVVVATDASNCVATTTVYIPPTLPLSLSAVINPACNQSATGSLCPTAVGGTPPYNYTIVPGFQTASPCFVGLQQGTYTVIVTDAIGCTYSSAVSVPSSSLAYSSLSLSDDTVCNGDPIFVTATGVNSYTVSAVSYNCGSSSTQLAAIGNANFNAVGNGTVPYLVHGVTASSCAIDTIVKVFLDNPTISISTPVSNFAPCNSVASVDLKANYSPNYFSPPCANSSSCYTPIAASVQFVSINNPPVLSSAGNKVFYNDFAPAVVNAGSTYPLTVAVGPFGNSAVWIDFNHNGSFDAIEFYNLFNNSPSGTVNIMIPITAIPGLTAMRVISHTAPLNSSLGCTTNPFYDVRDFLLNVNGVNYANNYTWMPGALSGDSINVPLPSVSTTYTVSTTSPSGCVLQDTLTLNYNPSPAVLQCSSIGFGSGDTICNGNSISATISASGGVPPYTYLWTNAQTNLVFGSAPNIMLSSIVNNLVLKCKITDACGDTCVSIDTLYVVPAINTLLSNVVAPVCANGSGSFSLSSTGGYGAYQYTCTQLGVQNSTQANFININPGTFVVTTTDLLSGCTKTNTLTFNSTFTTTASSIANLVNCNQSNGSITVNASGGSGNYTYQCQGANYNSGVQSNNVFSALPGGLIYTLTTTDVNNNCTRTNVVFLQNINQVLNLSTNVVSNASCSLCNGVMNCTGSGGSGISSNYLYNLMPGNVNNSSGQFTSLCMGVYTVTFSDITNNCNISDTISINGSVATSITANALPNSACTAANGSISASAVGSGTQFDFTLNPNNITNQSGLFSNLSSGTYTVWAISSANNCGDSAIVVVGNSAGITCSALGTDDTCGLSLGQVVVSSNSTATPVTFTINTNPVQSNNTGIFNNLPAGVYQVDATDANLCYSATTVQINNIINGLQGSTVIDTLYDENCLGSSDGAILLTVNGNTGPYDFNWTGWPFNVPSRLNLASGTYDVFISDNANHCQNFSYTINLNSSNCGSIAGTVINDLNSNCVIDGGELGIANTLISLSNGKMALTNTMGNFSIANNQYGTYTINQTPVLPYFVNPCIQPNSVTINATAPNLSSVDFYDSNSTCDFIVNFYHQNYIPGFVRDNYVCITGNNYTNAYGTLKFVKAAVQLFDASVLSNAMAVIGDTAFYNISSLPQCLTIKTFTPATVALGTPAYAVAEYIPGNCADINYNNNLNAVYAQILGSWDPNNKEIQAAHLDSNNNITLLDSVLLYTVNFQNTGTYLAQNVVIADTLSNKLDINSLKVVQASHNYDVEIVGNAVKFKFINIMLPDSNSDEPGSHGFIRYRIKQKNGNLVGDTINNTAHIYFDFNEAVVTNTTQNIIVLPQDLNQSSLANLVNIYPNPARTQVHIKLLKPYVGSAELRDILGNVIITKPLTGITQQLDVSLLAKGVYLLKVNVKGQGSLQQKLIVE